MELQVQVKTVYGNELVYPICDKAKALCSLTGAKTFSQHHIETIKELGYSFKLVSAISRNL
jgi:hypothetical protein